MSVRPQTPIPLPSEAEVKRLPALTIPPPSPLTSLSSPLPQIPSPPLPPPPSSLHLPPSLPASLFIPPVDRKEDTSKAKLPPHKRLCLTALTSRYERVEEVGYDIRDVWVDPTETVEEVARTTLKGVNDRVTELSTVQEQDTQDIYAMIEDTQDRQTQIYQRGQLSAALRQIQALQARDQTHAGDCEGAGSYA
ncbi:hypothetical protein Tco_0273992 [Tanacetum coccineum]